MGADERRRDQRSRPGGDARAAAARVIRFPGTLLARPDRKSTRLNSSHRCISHAVFCLKNASIERKDRKVDRVIVEIYYPHALLLIPSILRTNFISINHIFFLSQDITLQQTKSPPQPPFM